MWTLERARQTFHQPFADLLFQAQTVHRQNFDANTLQVSELLSIKTGGCPEDCSYCPQSAHHGSRPSSSQLMPLEEVKAAAAAAKSRGSSRFCMGAAWRSLSDRDTQAICTMVREVKSLGMETCMTLGMLQAHQARALQEAGLDYYNHNVDTSPEFYGQIISTRTFADRMQTLQHVRSAGLKICSGGILGLGESQEDRFGMLLVLANMEEPPESVPINHLVKVEGTPLAKSDVASVDVLDFIRNIALARLMLPNSYIRLSAGREAFSVEAQALCFLAGANSFFYGDRLLTTANQAPHQDELLLSRLGMKKEPAPTNSLAT